MPPCIRSLTTDPLQFLERFITFILLPSCMLVSFIEMNSQLWHQRAFSLILALDPHSVGEDTQAAGRLTGQNKHQLLVSKEKHRNMTEIPSPSRSSALLLPLFWLQFLTQSGTTKLTPSSLVFCQGPQCFTVLRRTEASSTQTLADMLWYPARTRSRGGWPQYAPSQSGTERNIYKQLLS